MLEWIGWVATAIFAASYLYKEPNVLRCFQAVAALLWICYGLFIHAAPVVVANSIVAVMALSSVWLQHRNKAKTKFEEPTLSRTL